MYHHVKKLMYTVNIGEPDVRFGNMLLEQFGGANGELAAAMQYTIQGWNCVDDLGRRDLLMDIGTEELSHLEVVGALIRMHLRPLKTNREAAEADPLVTIAGGGGVALFDSMGNAWTANYLKVTGELDVDLRSNIAAEARAKIVYERLIDHTDDPGGSLPSVYIQWMPKWRLQAAGCRCATSTGRSPAKTEESRMRRRRRLHRSRTRRLGRRTLGASERAMGHGRQDAAAEWISRSV
ncbi:MAG TPA: manganese catalase family protein [Edaphobacter sp.]|jgi:hypothetical protein|nr:manganese catalase family protein [Edaphobacter sp.]